MKAEFGVHGALFFGKGEVGLEVYAADIGGLFVVIYFGDHGVLLDARIRSKS
jgi:hypothetical protein